MDREQSNKEQAVLRERGTAGEGPRRGSPSAESTEPDAENESLGFFAARPLVVVGLLYTSGVVLARWIELPLLWLFVEALAMAITALFVVPLRRLLFWPLVPLVGAANLTSRTALLAPHDLRALVGDAAEIVMVRGTLTETPVKRVYERDDQTRWRSIAQVEVSEIHRKQAWQRAIGSVAISTPGVVGGEFFTGQAVEITGTLHAPKSRVAEGLFDYRAYLSTLGIYFQLTAESTNDWHVVNDGSGRVSPPWPDRFLGWAQTTLAKGLPVEDESLRLVWAMALGWKTGLTQEVSEPFMRSGTLHIFAISGLHIALIAGILVSVLRVVRLPRPVCGLIAVPLIWFYTVATGWQASAIRSAIMMNVIIAGWALERPSDLVNSLAAAGLIILVWDPLQFFQAGFQLSFFVVLSMGLLLPAAEKVRQWVLKTDPLLPAELRPRWQRCLDGPLHWLTASFATSLAAWLGSLPLIAHYFYLITPVSLLANMVIVPLSSLALMSNLGSLTCGDWLPWFTVLFNHSGWFWMKAMVWASQWAADLPGAYFYVRPPSLLEFVLYYLVLGACWSGWIMKPRRRAWATFGVVGLAAAWLIQCRIESRTVRLTILPLGGSGLFYHAPERKNDLLIDCGSRSAAEFTVRPFLHSQGVKRLSQVLLTHGDINHVGGWSDLQRHFSPASVFTGSARFRSPSYRQIIAELEKTPARWHTLRRGDQLSGWAILHPDAEDRFPLADDHAIVLYGEISGVRILLLSNLRHAGQRALLDRAKGLRADIIVTGAGTRGEAVMASLTEAVQPRLIVVASAESPSRTRANRQVRAGLARSHVPVIYTSEAGAVTIVLRPQKCEVRALNESVIPFSLFEN